MNFMDADVCIDLVRKVPEAIAWLDTLTELPAVPGFVAMELLAGCQSGAEYRYNLKFLKGVAIVWASDAAMQQAMDDFLPLRLSHGVGVLDCLIAAVAKEQGGTLFHVQHTALSPFARHYRRRTLSACSSLTQK